MCILFPSLHSIIKAISSSTRKGQLAKFPLISILISTNPNYPFLQPLMMDHPLLLVMLTNEASGLIKEGKAQTSI